MYVHLARRTAIRILKIGNSKSFIILFACLRAKPSISSDFHMHVKITGTSPAPCTPFPTVKKRCYVPALGILDIEQFKYYVYLCRVS